MTPLALSIVVPLRTSPPDVELGARLGRLVPDVAEVIVADGSDPEVQDAHAAAWPSGVRQVRLAPGDRTPMGKVGGVLCGARAATQDVVVLADDDVVWDRPLLARALARMEDEGLDLLRPQNRYEPLTPFARWDTGRALVQRALGGDWPGTVVVRRSALVGGYRGDVLFENLELERTVAARGGTVAVDLTLLVPRTPPTPARFREQRVREAYDELARPAHLVAGLAVLPVAVLGGRRAVVALVAGSVALAEAGRRRAGGRASFPATSALWAPLWVGERAVTSWLALGARVVHGGVRYRDGRLRDAASSPRSLRRSR